MQSSARETSQGCAIRRGWRPAADEPLAAMTGEGTPETAFKDHAGMAATTNRRPAASHAQMQARHGMAAYLGARNQHGETQYGPTGKAVWPHGLHRMALNTCGVASELPEKIAALKHPHGLFFQRRALHHLVVAPEACVIPLPVYLALQVVEEQHIAPLPQPLALAHVEHERADVAARAPAGERNAHRHRLHLGIAALVGHVDVERHVVYL